MFWMFELSFKIGDSYYMLMFWMFEYNRCFKMFNTFIVLDDCINLLFLDVRVYLFFLRRSSIFIVFRWVFLLFWIFGVFIVLDVWVRIIVDGGWAYVGWSFGSGRIIRFIGVLVLFIVIIEVGVVVRAFIVNFGIFRIVCGYYCIVIINNKYVFSR